MCRGMRDRHCAVTRCWEPVSAAAILGGCQVANSPRAILRGIADSQLRLPCKRGSRCDAEKVGEFGLELQRPVHGPAGHVTDFV